MPPLTSIPNGSNLFLDANILVYGIERRSAECRTLLERCSREEVTGICSYSVIIEATYQFLVSEARKKGYLTDGGGGPRKFFKEHPEAIRAFRDYWTDAERIFSLNLLTLEADEPILRQAQIERQNAGLLPMDSLIVAYMRTYGIPMLATRDNDFGRVNGIQVFEPSDI